MAYKSKGGCTPITAKIKRTTQGGMITQPLLDMGAPVKMKASSPAKQTETPEEAFKNEMASQAENAAKKAKALKEAKAKSDVDTYNKNLNQYRSDVSSLGKNKNTAAASYNPYGGSGGNKTRVRKQEARILDFENNLYNYDKKNKPGSTEGYTAKEYAMAKASGTYKPKTKKEDPKTTTTTTTTTTTSGGGGDKTKKVSYDTAYKNRDQKTYGNMTKAEYIKEAKRQNASKKAGKGWDVKGMGKSTTNKKNTTTKSTTSKSETSKSKTTNSTSSKKKDTKQYDLTNVTGSTLYQVTNATKKIGGKISNAVKKARVKKLTASADRKTDKAARKQKQADAAIVAGKTNKAARKQAAADRKKARAKKKGQAAKAIKVSPN